MTAEGFPKHDDSGQDADVARRLTRHPYRCAMRWGDMDAQAHINNVSFLDYLQEARVHFLLTGPVVMRDLLATGVLVVSHQVEYVAPVEFGSAPLVVELWVDAVGGSRFVIGYDVFDSGVLAARARTAAVPFDLATQTLRRLSPEERTVLADGVAPTPALSVLPRVRIGGTLHRFPLALRWSDLDSYGHVNNVRYFDYLQEARIALIVAVLGWTDEDVWLVVRQDIDYLRPMDFRLEPYEVATMVTAIGNRSFRLAVEIRDPGSGDVFASARTVVVGAVPLSETRRAALSQYLAAASAPDSPEHAAHSLG
ncbi:MAG TPA: thioesterase family protein [Propionibacteriaceae bacterium]